jgi:hypothetical protein
LEVFHSAITSVKMSNIEQPSQTRRGRLFAMTGIYPVTT